MGICMCCEEHDCEEEIEDKIHKVYVNKYEGNKNEMNQRHGFGTYFFQNGDMYKGDWKNDEKHGRGVYNFRDGRVYDGYFENDRFVGCEMTKSLIKEMKKKEKHKKKKKSTPQQETVARTLHVEDDGLIVPQNRIVGRVNSAMAHEQYQQQSPKSYGSHQQASPLLQQSSPLLQQAAQIIEAEERRKQMDKEKMEKTRINTERVRQKYGIPAKR